MMIRTLILILFLINVMGSKIDGKNKEIESEEIQLEVGAKLLPVQIHKNKEMYRNLNNKYSPFRYVPTPILAEGSAGFEEKYDMIKANLHYFRFFIERFMKYLISHKFHHVGSAPAVIHLIDTYLFSARSITTVDNDDTLENHIISDLTASMVDLLAYKPTTWTPFMVVPELPYRKFQSLKWFFLDLSAFENRNYLEIENRYFNLFCKCYLLLGRHLRHLFFSEIKWSLIKFIRACHDQERISRIYFINLKDPLYLHAEQHHLPKFIEEFHLQNTDINYIAFREGTIINDLYFALNKDRKIQWNNIFLPYIKMLHVSSYLHQTCSYQGKELEHVQYPKRVQELFFGTLNIQKLDLSRFTNVKLIIFFNCPFTDSSNHIVIPEHASVEINVFSNEHFFNANFTHLRLNILRDPVLYPALCALPITLKYPPSLTVLELWFQRSYETTNWYENLTAENVSHLHALSIHIYSSINLLLELKNQLKVGNLQLKHFFCLRELNIISTQIIVPSTYDFYTFINDVTDLLPNSLQEIRDTVRDPADRVPCQTQIWRQNEFFDKSLYPETVYEIRDRFIKKI